MRVFLASSCTMLVLLGSGCAAMNPAEPTGAQSCREYATAWTSTSTFGPPSSTSATFDSSTFAYSERSPANSESVVRRAVYARLADFIDETGVMGRLLSTRIETCASASCGGGLVNVQVMSYDSQRRLTGLMLQTDGFTMVTESYTSWDNHGRPTAGTRSQPGICTIPLTLVYDDVGRTLTVSPNAPNPSVLCLGVLYQNTQGFDLDGNLIRETGSAGGTETTTLHTIGATAKSCK